VYRNLECDFKIPKGCTPPFFAREILSDFEHVFSTLNFASEKYERLVRPKTRRIHEVRRACLLNKATGSTLERRCKIVSN